MARIPVLHLNKDLFGLNCQVRIFCQVLPTSVTRNENGDHQGKFECLTSDLTGLFKFLSVIMEVKVKSGLGP